MARNSLRLFLTPRPLTELRWSQRVGFPCSPALNRQTELAPVKGASRRGAMALRATPDGG